MCRLYYRVLVIGGFIFCLFSSVFAYSGGFGTEISPYQISNVSDWNDLMVTSSDWDKNFILTADVNLQGIALTPIGNLSINFTGVFDGNNLVISNADTNSPTSSYIGLFGYIGPGSQVRNLGVENVSTTGSSYIGGLAGYNKGFITACYTAGTVTGYNDYVGNLAGYNQGTITASHSAGTVSGGSFYIGGLVGFNYQGDITACYAAGTVSGNSDIGGLVGKNFTGSISDCCAIGSVAGDEYGWNVGGLVGGNLEGSAINGCSASGTVTGGFYVGGLVGYNYGTGNTITNCYAAGPSSGDDSVGGLIGFNNRSSVSGCYAAGNVSGNNNIGGLVGENYYYLSTITNCYATGIVDGNNNIGGLVGDNWNAVTNCYAAGSVTGDTNIGGLVGHNSGDGSVTASLWDVNTTGRTTSAGGEGKTTDEMKTLSTFTNESWDFNTPLWKICDGTNYPKLAWQQPFAGDFVCPDGVNFGDYSYLAQQWLFTNCELNNDCDGTDMNIDGTVNFIDLALFTDNWLEGI
jgi:hypothetical protein